MPMRREVKALLVGVSATAMLCILAIGHGASRSAQAHSVELEIVAPGLYIVDNSKPVPVELAKPRRMFLYKMPAPMQSLAETIGPGSLEIDPGREGAGVGGGSDEEGQCFADITCGPSCANCEKCQCLMDDGR